MDATAAVIEAQGYTFRVRSVAGVESCVCVDGLDVAFDLGCLPAGADAAAKAHVFISHGHTDHIAALATHAARRSLQGRRPASYYVAEHLAPLVTEALAVAARMQEDASPFAANVVPLAPFDAVRLPKGLLVRAVPTTHRVRSLGFILYKCSRRLRPELVGLDGKEIAARRASGEDVTAEVETAEIAYTGDTTADVFDAGSEQWRGRSEAHDLVRVKVLITEATYVDDRMDVAAAVERGHTHLHQLAKLEDRLAGVGTLLLVHFSARYSRTQLLEAVSARVPPSLQSKLKLGI